MKRLCSIISLLALAGAQCVFGHTRPVEGVNLGNTPWRFHRIIKSDENVALKSLVSRGPVNLPFLADGDFTQSKDIDASVPVTVTFPVATHVEAIEVHFAGDSIKNQAVSIEGCAEGDNWVVIADGLEPLPCEANTVNDLASVDETFGFVKKTVSTFARVPVDASFQKIRLFVGNPVSEIVVVPQEKDELSVETLTSLNFNDEEWEEVGIPHCYNEKDTYLNSTKGELCWRGEAWYRKKIFFDKSNKGERFFLKFNGVNIGATVYVNGHPVILRTTEVEQPSAVTHIGSSIPFTADITPFIKWGAENQIAVRVSNSKNTFFTYPGFAENEGFGQAMGGIVSPVYLYSKNPVHIPFNTFAPHGKWGTYFGTVKADENEASLRFLTNVENSSGKSAKIKLVTNLIDKEGKTVLSFEDTKQSKGGETVAFDFSGVISKPDLWWPNGSKNGSPYLYTVENSVYVNGKLCDRTVEKMGIRSIEWDDDYCYVNGEKTFLRGFGYRNNYPGLGGAPPVDLRRKDMELIAECGGNALRVGHQPPFYEAIEACDELGILIILNSGDNEWTLKGEPISTYKFEYDRDAIVAFRNHPSIAVWESNNGLPGDDDKYPPSRTLEQAKRWDFIAPRIVLNRDGYPADWDKNEKVVVGYTNKYDKIEGSPSLNTEVYGTNWSGNPSFCIARHDYGNEVKFSQFYVDDYLNNKARKACGWIDWMLAETYGEGYTIYLNGKRDQKSLGSCAMDGNRFPKLKYRIYRDALWNDFSKHPGVALQSHWNLMDTVDVNVWSNCPEVELLLNGKSLGKITPHPETKRCTWENIAWEPGKLEAVGLDYKGNKVCSELAVTAGEPHAIELAVEKGSKFSENNASPLLANGSDAFIVTAKIVDKNGNWCPFADNIFHFNVEGEGVYKGSYNFYIAEGEDMGFHAPGDPELQAEGGLMRAAVRTTFTPGDIKVTVSSPGLKSGSASISSIAP